MSYILEIGKLDYLHYIAQIKNKNPTFGLLVFKSSVFIFLNF